MSSGASSYLGNTSHTRAFVGGIHGVTAANDDAIAVVVDSDGQLGPVSSTRRVKEAIADIGALSERLPALRPVTFRYIQRPPGGSQRLQFGLIAEEVAAVFPELVAYGKDGQPLTVLYHVLPALLLNQLQRQQQEIEALRAAVDALRGGGPARHEPAAGVR
ncbi:MAG: tail fiber domain-containing protein [Candidatus Rokubacteria bacterium]|nr:tail fiber domain-containing protein [Candidatus Rokubacteria bacterium]